MSPPARRPSDLVLRQWGMPCTLPLVYMITKGITILTYLFTCLSWLNSEACGGRMGDYNEKETKFITNSMNHWGFTDAALRLLSRREPAFPPPQNEWPQSSFAHLKAFQKSGDQRGGMSPWQELGSSVAGVVPKGDWSLSSTASLLWGEYFNPLLKKLLKYSWFIMC